jgi:glyoxylase-like metal-dependent hydrolase (beta-lactamase superfamily II)
MALREIVPGIFSWPWFSERHGYDFNGYLIRHPAGNVAVDPVELPEPPGELLSARRIVLTNRNHFRAAAKLRELTGARVAVHAADAAFVKQQGVAVDETIADGSAIAGFTAVDAHGKSPGEIALWDASRKLLMVGDACVGKPPGALALLPAKVIDDLPGLQETLRRLSELEPEILLLGDGAPILSSAAEALRALVRSFA